MCHTGSEDSEQPRWGGPTLLQFCDLYSEWVEKLGTTSPGRGNLRGVKAEMGRQRDQRVTGRWNKTMDSGYIWSEHVGWFSVRGVERRSKSGMTLGVCPEQEDGCPSLRRGRRPRSGRAGRNQKFGFHPYVRHPREYLCDPSQETAVCKRRSELRLMLGVVNCRR